MANIILFDDYFTRQWLLPLTFTRPIADLRIGILTIRQKWEHYLGQSTSTFTEQYLQAQSPLHLSHDNIFVNAAVLPNPYLAKQVLLLEKGNHLTIGGTMIAIRESADYLPNLRQPLQVSANRQIIPSFQALRIVNRLWHIFTLNGEEIENDFQLLTAGRTSAPISSSNQLFVPENIFLEEGAKVECSILNASKGKIYIGKHAEIMEGCVIRGPLAMGEHSVIKMGAKIYGPTTLGLYCKVGGELNNVVFQSYSNKAHDGFLGNAAIGEWCNLGADTNNSNLKNNYSPVKMWNYLDRANVSTGLQFCGLVMGDHSKTGINTMLNTGTVIGVAANVFGGGFPPKFIPSFSWGGTDGFQAHQFEKATETARRMMGRRNLLLNEAQYHILKHIKTQTEQFRASILPKKEENV